MKPADVFQPGDKVRRLGKPRQEDARGEPTAQCWLDEEDYGLPIGVELAITYTVYAVSAQGNIQIVPDGYWLPYTYFRKVD